MVDIQSYIMLFIIWLVSMLIVRTMVTKTRKVSTLPPSPMALPIIGHLHLIGQIPHQAFHKLSTRYGPLIHIFLGSVPCLVASSAQVAKEFLKTHETCFSDRPQTIAAHYMTYGSADLSFANYGPYWKFMKKLSMSQLLGGRTLDQMGPVRREEIRRVLRVMMEKAKRSEAVDVGGELIRLSNNVITRMSMSKTCCNDENEAEDVRKLVKAITELTGKFNVSDYIGFCEKLDLQGFNKKVVEVRARFDTMMERIIMEHEEARKINKEMSENDGRAKDLIDILLDIFEDEASEMRLSKENIKAFIMDIFVAGTDTSATTIEWALSELINHPNILNKARQEIDNLVGKNRLVEETDVPNLPYLQAIVKETLRLHPTGPLILRQSSENCFVLGHHIPAKTRLFINVWAIGRDPNHWVNPLEFRPERFMDEVESGGSKLDLRGQHFHFLPFGSGRRVCPGTSLALQVIQTTLASLVHCFEWKFEGVVDMKEGPGLTLPRARPLICTPVVRLNPFPSF